MSMERLAGRSGTARPASAGELADRLVAEGWLHLRGAFPQGLADAARDRLRWLAADPQRLEQMEAEFDAPGAPRKLRRIFRQDPLFWTGWLEEAGVTPLAGSLLGGEPVLVFHAAFLKPAGVGSAVGYHQDQALWQADLAGAYSFWMPLDQADSANGGIEVCPGSHRAGLLPHLPVPDHPWHDVVDPAALGLTAQPVSSAPGDVLVWDRYLVHGSQPNTAERSRQAMVFVLMPADDRLRASVTDYLPLGGRAA